MTKIHANDRSTVYRVIGCGEHPPICVTITAGTMLAASTHYLTPAEAIALARQLEQAVSDFEPMTVAA